MTGRTIGYGSRRRPLPPLTPRLRVLLTSDSGEYDWVPVADMDEARRLAATQPPDVRAAAYVGATGALVEVLK